MHRAEQERIGADADGSLPDDELSNFRSTITAGMARIPREVATQDGWFACFNTRGDRPPVFWCFNNWTEAVFLAHWLGPHQPLFAMHSLHTVVAGKSVKKLHTELISESYAEQLLKRTAAGSITLGGNCQAAPIAEAMAHRIIAATGKAPLLIALEHQPFYCYPGSLLMLFGSESVRFNPFLQGEDPVPAWQRKHRSPSWGIIDGDHGRYFNEPAVHQLTAYLLAAAGEFHTTGSLRGGRVCADPIDPGSRGA